MVSNLRRWFKLSSLVYVAVELSNVGISKAAFLGRCLAGFNPMTALLALGEGHRGFHRIPTTTGSGPLQPRKLAMNNSGGQRANKGAFYLVVFVQWYLNSTRVRVVDLNSGVRQGTDRYPWICPLYSHDLQENLPSVSFEGRLNTSPTMMPGVFFRGPRVITGRIPR